MESGELKLFEDKPGNSKRSFLNDFMRVQIIHQCEKRFKKWKQMDRYRNNDGKIKEQIECKIKSLKNIIKNRNLIKLE